MKFYRQLKLNNKSPTSLELTYKLDGQIIMDIPNPTAPLPRPTDYPILRALRIPTGTGDPKKNPGTPENERPSSPYDVNGLIRYNTTLEALEVLKNGTWIQLRAKEPANIRYQTFTAPPPIEDLNQTYVDGIETFFGPLLDSQLQPPASAKNIFVYVENVFQIPETNYIMVPSTSFTGPSPPYPLGQYLQFFEPPPLGKNVTVIHGFD